ncbi:Ribosomal large subunit pseudouridine synthase A [compost metagenome]
MQTQLGVQIFPVHRLDFEVSGLVLYAKNAEAHRVSNICFENRWVEKTYRALTTSQDFSHIPANVANPRQHIELSVGQTFEWKSRILRGKKRAFESPQGKDSLTESCYLGKTADGFLRWDLHPVTGRSHQLRFDLSRHGFPILGDELYGSKENLSKNTIALCSFGIKFLDSAERKLKSFGLPSYFEIAVDESAWSTLRHV